MGEFIEKNKWDKEKINILFATGWHRYPVESLTGLKEFASKVYLLNPEAHRTDSDQVIQTSLAELKSPEVFKIIEGGDIKKTLDFVLRDPLCQYVVVCGSFVLMAHVRGYFEPEF